MCKVQPFAIPTVSQLNSKFIMFINDINIQKRRKGSKWKEIQAGTGATEADKSKSSDDDDDRAG